MKRILIIMSLAVLVMPLILAGCSCGGGTTLTEGDVTTIRGFGTRLDGHDQAIAKINTTLGTLDSETLNKLAALDATALAALLNLDLDTALADIEKLKTDVSDINDPDKDGSLAKRVKDLENDQSGGSDDGNGTPSGELTVVLDGTTPFEVYTDKDMTSPYRFSVTITNGTEDWKAVSYCVNFTCVSVDGNAKVNVVKDGDVIQSPKLTASSSSYGGVAIPFEVTYVPSEDKAWQVFFTPTEDFEVVVSPGKATTVYHVITLGTDGFELWEVTLTGITVIKL